MQTLYVPKYNLHYRVNPRNPRELQWSRKPFGPATQWQHAMSFRNPIRALDLDDETKQGVVVLNDSTTYVGSGVRTWGRKFYPAGTRIYSLYAIGESLDIKVGTDKEFDCLRYCSTLELPNGVCVPVRACIRCMRFAAFTFRVVGFGEVDPELYPDAGTAKCFIHGYYPVYGPEHKPSDEFVIYCDDVSALQQWSDRNGWGVGIGRAAPSMAVAKEIETNKKLGLIPERRHIMSKLKIKVHESRISRLHNKDMYYEWMESEGSDAPQCIEDDNGMENPYFPIYIDNPDNPAYDEKTLEAKIQQTMDFVRKNLSKVKNIQDVEDYFTFELEDGGVCDVDIIIKPKDVLFDESIDDIKYIANRAIHIIDDAFGEDKVFSDSTLRKEGLLSDTVGM